MPGKLGRAARYWAARYEASQHSAHLGPAARQQAAVQVGRPQGLEPGARAGGWCDRGTLAVRAYLTLGAEAMSGMQKLYTSAEHCGLSVRVSGA